MPGVAPSANVRPAHRQVPNWLSAHFARTSSVMSARHIFDEVLHDPAAMPSATIRTRRTPIFRNHWERIGHVDHFSIFLT